MEKKFILCLGSPKTATTSLQKALQKLHGVDFGLMKEYHVFDALYTKECGFFLGRATWDKNDAKKTLRTKMQNNLDFYFSYFAELLRQSNIEVTGDFTPTHLCLNDTIINSIVSRFSLQGVKVKLIFLMRDPLQQYWSGIRMNRRNAKNGSLFSRLKFYFIPEIVHLLINLYNPYYRMQHRYEIPLKALTAFQLRDVLILNQEQLSAPNLTIKLEDFLEMDLTGFALSRENVTRRSMKSLPGWFQRLFVSTRWETYQFCLDRYPHLRSLWASSKFCNF